MEYVVEDAMRIERLKHNYIITYDGIILKADDDITEEELLQTQYIVVKDKETIVKLLEKYGFETFGIDFSRQIYERDAIWLNPSIYYGKSNVLDYLERTIEERERLEKLLKHRI